MDSLAIRLASTCHRSSTKFYQMVKLYFSVFLLSLSIVVTAQTTIAVQDFETTPASPAWNYTSSGGTVSSVNTGTPANGRIRNGLNSFQSSNLASALSFDAIDVSSYSNVKITVHVSSISGTGSNGADAAD